MTSPTQIPHVLASLDEVAANYDAIFCDVWGVVHDGVKLFKPAIAALARFKAAGKPVILVSNAPVPNERVAVPIARLGADPSFYDAIVTSGDVTRAELRARAPGPAFHIGPSFDKPLFEGLNLVFAPLKDAAFIACTALNDETDNPSDYREILIEAVKRRLDFVCANPDVVVKVGERLYYCAGAVAEIYAQLGGAVIQAGKPYAPIYDAARIAAERVQNGAPARRVLAIGDSAATDVRGANGQGLDVLFVAHGIHGEELSPDGPLDGAELRRLLDTANVQATFAMRELA